MLEAIRVVDCSTDIAGPYCTKLLADAGADVVKVETPAGDPLRRWGSGALFEFLNTSKRSVVASPGDTDGARRCARAPTCSSSPDRPGRSTSRRCRRAIRALVAVVDHARSG